MNCMTVLTEKEFLTLAPIWLPHWPACIWTISRIFLVVLILRCNKEVLVKFTFIRVGPLELCVRKGLFYTVYVLYFII